MLTATEPRAKKLTYKGLCGARTLHLKTVAILLLRLYLLWLYLLLGILTTGPTDYAAILTTAILTMAILAMAILTTSPGSTPEGRITSRTRDHTCYYGYTLLTWRLNPYPALYCG